ncbi:unnamed protein product [Ascophyllum nodosum]
MGLSSISIILICSLVGSAAATSRLDVVDLPMGFSPEGITNGDEWIAYVGSLIDGSIWKGDLSTGEGEVVVSGPGGAVAGLDHDRRSGYLYAAGTSSGMAHIYDDETWELVVSVDLAVNTSTFINDVIVTKTAAYFTDSFQGQIYVIPLNRADGTLVNGTDTLATVLPLEGFTNVEGAFNANGIEASDDGRTLIVANSQEGVLYNVDPETGLSTPIDLGGEAVNGDGLVLRKNTLWVIENSGLSPRMRIREVALSADFTCGFVSPVFLTSDMFDTPTTAMRKGNSLYVVQAKFGVPFEERAMTSYEIIRVDRDAGEFNCTAM